MLEIDDVSQCFGAVRALDHVSFVLRPGEVVGFVGRNGAGKTTAMRVILGLVEPDAGAVRWDGVPLDRAFRRRVGYLPEERGLYPKMGVTDQVRLLGRLSGLPEPEARRDAQRWVERVGLADRADDPLGELSLGNQQRVQVAAAMVAGRRLAVLDEPFSGLDPIGVELLAELLHEHAAAGAAVLFSSHQLDLVERLCRRVVIIERGRIIGDGEMTTGLREHVLALAAAPAGDVSAIDGVAP
ncbi:MAG: ABC transporter ATP-binding protein [Desertimonas sp.]